MTIPHASAADRKTEHLDEKEFERMTIAAKEFMHENLRKNREAAEIYAEMLPQIREFSTYAKVEPVVFKCMDGRTQTNDHKGIPPTVAINRRSQGGKSELSVGNRELWDVMHKERLRAESNDASLLVIAAAHRSDFSDSCAAFRQEEDGSAKSKFEKMEIDRRALEYMHGQAHRLRFELGKGPSNNKKQPAVLSGITNTDTGAMQLYGKDRELIFDAEQVMASEEILEPSEVFEGKFLNKVISEEWAHASIRNKTPQELLEGEDAPFFNDMRVKIALEAYLMRRITEGKAEGGAGNKIIRHDILKRLQANLGDLNDDVKTFLTYTMAANVAYSTHYRNLNTRLAKEDPEALKTRVNHGEKKMAYSLTGHDLEDPNSLLLIKPGSGDEEKSVAVGRDVLLANLENLGLKDKLPPVVHINIERTEPIDSWEDYMEVVSRMQTKTAIVEKVFGENVRMFTTYSYNQIVPTSKEGVCRTKQFMPLNANPANRKILIDANEDIGHGISKENFDSATLRKREKDYTFQDADKSAT